MKKINDINEGKLEFVWKALADLMASKRIRKILKKIEKSSKEDPAVKREIEKLHNDMTNLKKTLDVMQKQDPDAEATDIVRRIVNRQKNINSIEES